MTRFLNAVYRFLISLKLAVIVIVLLTVGSMAGTFIESIYDTKTAVYWVYGAWWFHLVLLMLGVNIVAVAVDRFPWKMRHIPFLLAHLGIVLTLVGSFLTKYRGVDGIMTVSEGEIANNVELPEHVLVVSDGTNEFHTEKVKWLPPGVKFGGIDLPEYGVKVDRYITHADAHYDFKPVESGTVAGAAPAVRMRLEGGPMNFNKEFWLWAGDVGWSSLNMGPASFQILPEDAGFADPKEQPGTRLEVKAISNGGLEYRALSKDGRPVSGVLTAAQVAGKDGALIEPGWMANTGNPLRIRVIKWVPLAVNDTRYTPSRIQYGEQTEPPAIRLVAGNGGPGSEIWLGLHDRAMLRAGDRELRLAFLPRQVLVPFGIRLDRFQIDHYQGTSNPKEFSSKVTLIETDPSGSSPSGFTTESMTISMNEPLEKAGYTLYQASYIPAEPRPVVSVFSVNQDPGRFLKYLGSLLLVAGSTALFAVKTAKRRRTVEAAKAKAPETALPVRPPFNSAPEEA